MSDHNGIRINKYLSQAGYCSRRQADRLLEEGRITINGRKPEMGTKVHPGDQVEVDGRQIENKESAFTYIAFNKPVGVVCTTNTKVEKNNIIDYINYPKRIYPIGRLDKGSEGLILLTDDGAIVNKILRSRNNQGKEYIVTVNKAVNREFIQGMANGVPILNTVTKKCKVWKTGEQEFHIVLTQGLNRQIRRMCDYFDYKVQRLKRIRVVNIELGNLPVGQYRDLTEEELKELRRIV